MSANTKSTPEVQIGKLLSEALTKKVIEIPINLAATEITNYFNLGSIANPDAYYITADRINAFVKETISLAMNTASHVTVKDYIKDGFDYALHPIFGHKQSDLVEISDSVEIPCSKVITPGFVKEDSVIDLTGEGVGVCTAY